MAKKILGNCPVCGETLQVKRLECPSCRTEVSGKFDLGKFSRLSSDQLEFVSLFIRLRGNIKEVEEEMGISYPTVRKKLDEVIEALGYRPEESPEGDTSEKRKEVLQALDEGEIEFEEAKEQLKEL